MNDKKESIYKSISEVAKILNLINPNTGKLTTHTLRYWEKEFPQIKPKIFSGKRRYYNEKSIKILKKIKFLLKEKGMTIKGVKRQLKSEHYNVDVFDKTHIRTKNVLKTKVKKISKLIKEIKNLE